MSAASLHPELPESVGSISTFIIIPAFNEGNVILEVLEELSQKLPTTGLTYQIVVVDDGSVDETYENALGFANVHSEQAQSLGSNQTRVHVLRHLVNLGQGASLATGIQYAITHGAQIVVTFDADGQHAPEDIPDLVAPILAGNADVTLGSRFLTNTGTVPKKRKILLKGAIIFTGLTEGIWLTDAHNGFRAFSADAARRIEITQNRMAHASEIVREIARLKLRYVEVPVHVRYTDYSRMKGQRATDALNILLELLEDLLP